MNANFDDLGFWFGCRIDMPNNLNSLCIAPHLDRPSDEGHHVPQRSPDVPQVCHGSQCHHAVHLEEYNVCVIVYNRSKVCVFFVNFTTVRSWFC